MGAHRSLGQTILAAFRQAVAEDRPDVADHLLRALETLEAEPMPGSPLAEAYTALAKIPRRRRRPRQTH
ncbi:hypothetical protein [Microvirga sp. G4-2]|uniref:hypothetical protein n=1 Tax=Microvirga sp. G4-2 TaxID=3434467 RepID=UPI004044E57B